MSLVTTVEQARAIAEEYVAMNRPLYQVSGLLEDSVDYFVELKLSGDIPAPIGQALLFISKGNGNVREEMFGRAVDRIRSMTPVRS